MKSSIKLKMVKETKGAVQFKETNEKGEILANADAVVGTIYIRKTALQGESPLGILVTVETVG